MLVNDLPKEDAQPRLQQMLDNGAPLIELPPGRFHLRRGLVPREIGQQIVGSGMSTTTLLIINPANRSRGYEDYRQPAFTVESAFFTLKNMELLYTHPFHNAPQRTDAIPYAPAIDIRSPGLCVEDVMFSGAWDGIFGSSDVNAGRMHLERIYMGALNEGVRLDAATGTVQVTHFEGWPFGWTQQGWLNCWEGGTALQFGSIDNLQISDVIAFRTRVKFLGKPWPKNPELQPLRGPIGCFSNLSLDGPGSRLIMDAGKMNGTNVYKTTNSDQDTSNLDISGDAELCLTNLNIRNTSQPGPFVSAKERARVLITNALISSTANELEFTAFETADKAHLGLMNVDFEAAAKDPKATFLKQRANASYSMVACRGKPLLSNVHGATVIDAERFSPMDRSNYFPGWVN